jgi:crossover junction endodeoxyribonuclease RuvC
MTIVGIDPGLTGAVTFLDPESLKIEIVDMPVHTLTRGGKTKRSLDLAGLVTLLDPARLISHAWVELAAAMPHQGVAGVFSFGQSFGAILGILAAYKIPVSVVAPAVWKRALHVAKSKDAARARASQLLPKAAGNWPLKKHDGRAESALLAVYGARELNAMPAGSAPKRH